MKIISFFINVFYWLGLFISPVLIFCFVAFWLYSNKTIPLTLSVLIGVTGVISGIVIAEYVRKRYGLNNFWSGVSTNLQHDRNNKEENEKL